jgi:hypothetical protein
MIKDIGAAVFTRRVALRGNGAKGRAGMFARVLLTIPDGSQMRATAIFERFLQFRIGSYIDGVNAMKQQATKLSGVMISSTDAAALIGKSRNWIAKLVADGFVKKTGQLFRPADVAQGHIAFLTDERRRASKTATLAAVQAARADEIRLRIARADHDVVDLDEAVGVLDEIIGGLKADFDGLAAATTRDAAFRSVIEGKVDEILKRAADRLAQKAQALRASGTAVDADAEDDARPVGNPESTLSA